MSSDGIVIRNTAMLLPFAAAGFVLFFLVYQSIALAAGILIFAGAVALMLRWPESGAFMVLFAIYSNIGVLAMRSQRAVQLTAGSPDKNPRIAVVLAGLSLLMLVPLLFQVIIRKQKLIFDRGFVFMLALLAVYLASSFFALDGRLAASQVSDYLFEGLGLYFLLTNVIRDLPTLRRAIWSLLLAGSLMAGLSIFQKATHTEDSMYGGLAQVSSDFDLNTRKQEVVGRAGTYSAGGQLEGQLRAAGSIGETNRYGQVLVVLLPLAVLRFRTERSRTLRALALVAAGLILGGLFLTLSRGSILAGLVVFGMMAYMRLLKPFHVLASMLAVGVLVLVVEPGVLSRMVSLERLKGLFNRPPAASQAPDSSAVRRYVLNVAAWDVFMEHPILGVGPGHFAEYYAIPYGNRIGLVEQRKKYRGHNMYLETLAETGVAGLVCFLAIIGVNINDLWKARHRLAQSRPDLAYTASGFMLCLAAYAISAVFAHLSYQRYFWLLVALSSAAIRIVHSHSRQLSNDVPFLRQSEA